MTVDNAVTRRFEESKGVCIGEGFDSCIDERHRDARAGLRALNLATIEGAAKTRPAELDVAVLDSPDITIVHLITVANLLCKAFFVVKAKHVRAIVTTHA